MCLQILSASEGNILEDESAISVITEAKILGNEISSKQKVAEETEVQIEAARTAYKPCGDYTAILFFCISGASPCNTGPVHIGSLPNYTLQLLKCYGCWAGHGRSHHVCYTIGLCLRSSGSYDPLA